MSTSPETALEALQATLAAEHAALHRYGVLGGRVSASAEPALAQALAEGYRRHRARRDELGAAVLDAGGEPVAAAPTYPVPPALAAPALARLGRRLESDCAETYAAQVAACTGDQRRWAVVALVESATQALALGARPEAFPGAPDLD